MIRQVWESLGYEKKPREAGQWGLGQKIANKLGYRKVVIPERREMNEAADKRPIKTKRHPIGDGDYQPIMSPTGVARIRNLDPVEQDTVLNVVHYMYKFNPLASRAIQITAEYIIGDGIQFKAMNKGIQKILDRHWDNDTNKWQILQFERAKEFGLAGELVIPVWVNKYNGAVVLGHIDPLLIETVVPDGENSMKIHAIVIKRTVPKYFAEYHNAEYVAYKVINPLDDIPPDNPYYGKRMGLAPDEATAREWGVDVWKGKQDSIKVPVQTHGGAQYEGTDGFIGQGLRSLSVTWEGACFFSKINAPLGSTRGWSDLLPNLIWLDANDQLLFALVQKAINASRYLVDVLLENMNEQQQQEWLAKNYVDFTNGEWFTHNEGVTLSFPSPDLKMDDSTTLSSALKNHILAGVGHPPIWYSESLVSRASAPEMTEPSFKHIKVRQREYGYLMGQIFRFVIDQAVVAGGMISREEARGQAFYIKMPDVSAKDQRMLAISIANIGNALKALCGPEIGWDKTKAHDFFERYIEMTGLDIWKYEPQSDEQTGVPEQNIDKMLTRMLNESDDMARRIIEGVDPPAKNIDEAINRAGYQRHIKYDGHEYFLYGEIEEAQKLLKESVEVQSAA